MTKKKIKDMTTTQLKAYRKKQSTKLKKKKEKEAIEEERKVKQRSKAAKKAAATKKINKKKKEISVRKAIATRKRNAAVTKKDLRKKKKAELEKKRAEKRKNKIVVPRSKSIKDMTPEEYLKYKKEYARIYNERKRRAENKKIDKNVTRRLSGKALNAWNSDSGKITVYTGRKFSEMNEGKRYIMHPRVNNGMSIFRAEGLNAYCEITAAVSLYVIGRKKTAEVSLNCFVLPSRASGSQVSVRDFWIQNVSDMIPDLTDRNFHTLLQPITHKEIDKIMEWSTLRFLKACIDHGQKHRQITAEILWLALDKDYTKKNNITAVTLDEMSKSRKKRVKKKLI